MRSRRLNYGGELGYFIFSKRTLREIVKMPLSSSHCPHHRLPSLPVYILLFSLHSSIAYLSLSPPLPPSPPPPLSLSLSLSLSLCVSLSPPISFYLSFHRDE